MIRFVKVCDKLETAQSGCICLPWRVMGLPELGMHDTCNESRVPDLGLLVTCSLQLDAPSLPVPGTPPSQYIPRRPLFSFPEASHNPGAARRLISAQPKSQPASQTPQRSAPVRNTSNNHGETTQSLPSRTLQSFSSSLPPSIIPLVPHPKNHHHPPHPDILPVLHAGCTSAHRQSTTTAAVLRTGSLSASHPVKGTGRTTINRQSQHLDTPPSSFPSHLVTGAHNVTDQHHAVDPDDADTFQVRKTSQGSDPPAQA